MLLDHQTLLVSATIVFSIMALIQILFGYKRYRYRPSLDMGLASLLFALRALFYLFQTQLPGFLEISAILAIGFETMLGYRAIRGVVGLKPMTRFDWVMFFLFMGLGFVAGFVTNYSLDQIIHSCYILHFFIRAIMSVLNVRHKLYKGALALLMAYLSATCVVSVYRGFHYTINSIESGVYATDPLTTPTTFALTLIFFIGNIGVFILAMMTILERAMDERDFAKTLVSVIGHDLNGYLASTRQATELLKDRADPAIPLVESSIGKAQNLLTDLVYWSRSRNDDKKPIESPVVLQEIISETVMGVLPAVEKKELKIWEPKTQRKLVVFVDEVALAVVLRNVLTNAVKFSPRGESILIELAIDESRAVLRFSDRGPGISKTLLKDLSRGVTVLPGIGSAGEKGLGTGLRIVSSICRSNEWSLEISSREGGGTAVLISLPIHQDDGA